MAPIRCWTLKAKCWKIITILYLANYWRKYILDIFFPSGFSWNETLLRKTSPSITLLNAVQGWRKDFQIVITSCSWPSTKCAKWARAYLTASRLPRATSTSVPHRRNSSTKLSRCNFISSEDLRVATRRDFEFVTPLVFVSYIKKIKNTVWLKKLINTFWTLIL